MPRKARINSPGVLQHVMARGIDGRDLFKGDDDRNIFLNFFKKRLQEVGYKCYAWVLMDNHYHLLLRTSEKTLSGLMKPLNSDYARYFNRKRERRGYVFQDRYKSIATQDQFYIEQIVRYIHLNPYRAGLCRNMEQLNIFPWSGHSAIMGTVVRDFQDSNTILRRFGSEMKLSRQRYSEFISEAMVATGEDALIVCIRRSNNAVQNRHSSDCWVIGDKEFVEKVLKHDAKNRIRIARYKREGWDLNRLALYVSKKMLITPEQLRNQSKRTIQSDARKVFCHIGSRELGFSSRDLGEYLNISQAAVSASSRKGAVISYKKKMKIDDV